MGYNTIEPTGSSLADRSDKHNLMASSIHRALVTEVYIDRGEVQVYLERIGYSAKITIPLLALSAPPSLSEDNRADFKKASWGRYIPQVGDLLLVAFGTNMELYALGYTAVYYPGYKLGDEQNESTGGIGWGDTSGKTMKPGDWDFKSARDSFLYLGDKAKISSGPVATTYNKETQDITHSATLHLNKSSSSSQQFGAVRRFLLPTDTEESYVPSGRGITYAQEFTTAVKWDGIPGGTELARLAMGDVMDDSLPAISLKLSNLGQPTRRHFSANDFTGFIPVYDEVVDCSGNYEVTAALAQGYTWTTPLATWTTTNLNTNVTSSAAVSLTSGAAMNLTAGATMTLTGALLQLGSVAAVSPAVKGTEFTTALSTFLAAIVAAAIPGAVPDPTGVASATFAAALGSAAGNLSAALSNTLSTKVMVE